MKNKNIFLIVLFILFVSSVGQAQANSKVEVSINGYDLSVLNAPIVLNGKKISDAVPSFAYNNRTLVHVRFIEQLSDTKVTWEQETKSVIVDYKDKQLKLSIDMGLAYINGEKKVIDKGSIPRLVKYQDKKDQVTMVPLSFLAEELGFDVGWDYNNNSAFVNSKNIEKEPIENPEQPKDEDKSTDINTVKNITKEVVDDKDAIVIYGTKEFKWKTMKFKYPERIVIDLIDSTLDNSILNKYDYKLDFIKGIRLSQFSPDKNYNENDKIVRIVLDIEDEILNRDVKIDSYNDRIVITPIKTLPNNIGSDLMLEDEELDNTEDKLNDEIDSQIKNYTNSKPSDILIAIDPGHGGTQPGSTSPNGIKEKDVNLEISLKTEQALKNVGYNVLMTRTEDTTLGLYERSDIANANSADILISIHANSVENDSSVNGIEILYAPATPGSNKDKGLQVLTKIISEELINSTGAKNRGIIERPNVVVIRETKMPSILIEVGFLSNALEEQLITSSTYQEILVQAIVRGVEKYFQTY